AKRAGTAFAANNRTAGLVFSVVILFTSALASVALYGREVFPLIPPKFGGGRPTTVRLSFSPENARVANALGVPLLGPGASVSKPVCLLFEGSESYLLTVNRITLRLDKRAVFGVQSLSKQCLRRRTTGSATGQLARIVERE